ncbi:DUF305 domain-containing protein [Altererythrobacter sp. H2]|uniref:DUF305 domain-containing protein n=1 Tax=Altererythrobacter sp. H2 TaxID=3108391 RepID=UPI002B4C1302|nr:DUF305 domain-containing protein [Altererythrobacter sp. H2]WRK96494.1 DUF305 domain-containing protein [Altererythrobacter sp. H2]
MIKMTGIGALALLASLGACGSPEQPADDTAPAAEMDMDGPYAKSEMAMDKAMKAAVGVDAGDTWVKKMIAHHDGAIAMSRIVLGLEPTADVAKMAQMTIDNQGAEIEALKALARNGTADPESARLYEAAMTEMHSEMMAASGATPSETYLAKMLAHHRGAVAMSDIALANGATGAVRAQIEETRAEQLEEIAMVEAMLRGEPMTMQTQAKSAAAAPAATAKPAAPKAAAAKAAPAKPAAATPTAESAAEPEASPTCAPEHRAAGHC